ncbi:MAG: tRNA (adenosine(37)-N6)-threonylcarbamoyltransferase complex dimerization subunit type 1 TsaB [Nitrospirota bacterium]
MRLLAVESSTPESSVALALDDGAIRSEALAPGRLQTETLMVTIDRLLRGRGVGVQALDGFAVAVGPGAFIGVRVGIATVKGLALATGRLVAPASSLEALAERASDIVRSDGDRPPLVCAMLDARRGEVYAASYRLDERRELVRIGEERLVRPEDFLAELKEPALFIGDGARMHQALIRERLGDAARFPPVGRPAASGAEAVARLALRRWPSGAVDPADVTATYLRPAVVSRSA